MKIFRRTNVHRVKSILAKIEADNLFLLASSTSYYSALAIAPFLMILLGVSSLIGSNIQHDIVEQASLTIAPEVGLMIELIFKNVNEGVNFASITGLIGVIVLLFTASTVFLQLRFSFDIIYGTMIHSERSRPIWDIVKDRLFAMGIVIMTGVFFIVSFTITAATNKIISFLGDEKKIITMIALVTMNFVIYYVMFLGIHYFTPTKKPQVRDASKISLFSAIFFFVGNLIMASYLKRVAADSIYGAAGTLVVFLLWSYYTSFTVFLSVEVFQYLKSINKIK